MLNEFLRRGLRARLKDAVTATRWFQHYSPSSSLYFADPLGDLIGGWIDVRRRPIRRLSRTVFVSGDMAVVIRYACKRDLALLERRKFSRVYLLVDDDFFALHENDGLPADYRERLVDYRDGLLQRLLKSVTHVVAPSERILSCYSKKQALLLDPAQCHPDGGLGHHRKAKGLDIVFAATRSHLYDLDLIADPVAEFLKARPDARLTTFLNGHAPKVLKRLPNTIHLPMLGWGRYRAFVAENRFHVAIAPALETDFNRARSLSKLHDHAAFGAAGIYSHQAPFSNIVSHGASGLLLPNDPAKWKDALFQLADQRSQAEGIAAEGQELSRRVGDRRRVRQFWLKELQLN